MASQIRPIETVYKGYRFRSRLEARWAVFFDALGVRYEYEPEGFELPSGRRYLPDFRVMCWGTRGCHDGPPFDLYIEVKGHMTQEDADRVKEFVGAKYIAGSFFGVENPTLIVGSIPPEGGAVDSDACGSYERMDDTIIYPFNYETIDGDYFAAYPTAHQGRFYLMGDDSSYIDERGQFTAEVAYRMARQVRFEHGETPRPFDHNNQGGTNMPKLRKSWKDIEESKGGSFGDIEPGAYVLVITKVEPHEDQEYVRVYWDVADGPSKGNYADSQYPPSDVLSWKDAALGMLKHKLHVLADWNQGFQPTVAFDGDQWELFKGKRLGAVVRRRLYTAGPRSKTPGADRISMEIAEWLHPEAYESGDFSERLLADRDQRDKGAAQPQAPIAPPAATAAAALYDEDVPF